MSDITQKKFLDEEGLATVFDIICENHYNKTEIDDMFENNMGGESCSCPPVWSYLGFVEFDFSYTTTDDKKLELPASTSVISHTWDDGEKKGKIQFNASGVPKRFFYLQETLKTIDIVAPCPKIGEEAFRGCTNLSQITLGDTVIKLGVRSFQNCQPLNNVVIPEGVKEIPDACFIGCHITEYDDYGKTYKDGLITITLPESLERIGAEAFEDCTGLKNVEMPKNVKVIDTRAFQQCEKLTFTDWDFFKNIEELGEKAFQSCHVLNFPNNVLEIPEKITEIKPETFSFCYGVKEIKLPAGLVSLASKAFFTTGYTSSSNLPLVIDKITIPSSLKTIGKQCFASDRASDGGKEQIGHVTVLAIDVEDINEYVKINFEDKNSHPNGYANVTTKLLINGEEKRDIEITADITELDQYMFSNIFNVDSIKLPNTLEKIENRAFLQSSISNIDLTGSNIKFIGNYAFDTESENLTVNFSNSNLMNWEIESNAFTKTNNKISFNFSNSTISTIEDKMFYENVGLTNINLSNAKTLNKIGSQAFFKCWNLEEINLTGCTGLQTISEQAFSQCESLENVDLSNLSNLTTIDKKAFEKCTKLKTVNLTGCTGLQTIGEQAFYTGDSNTSEVEEIDLSTCISLTIIGSKAFPHITKLTVNDTASYLGGMRVWTTNNSGDSGNKILTKVIIKGTTKVAEGLHLTNPTYYVEESMLAQYQSTYPNLTFEKIVQ